MAIVSPYPFLGIPFPKVPYDLFSELFSLNPLNSASNARGYTSSYNIRRPSTNGLRDET